MPAQRLLQEVSGKVAATAAFLQGMTLEIIHHTARQGDVDPLGAGCVSHISTAGDRPMAIDLLLQLLNQILKKRHGMTTIYHLYYIEFV